VAGSRVVFDGSVCACHIADGSASDRWGITLIFGLPIVFVASLFGAYIVQLRRGEDEMPDEETIEQVESE